MASNTAENQETAFAIADTKLYVPVVTLSTQDNAKLLQKLKSGFKRTINWNKYQPKVSILAPNLHLDYLIDPSFQGVNRLLVLSFENSTDRTVHAKYYLKAVEIKDYNVMMDGQNVFDQLVKNNLRTDDNIRKIAICQGDDYTAGCLLDYNNFKDYYKMIPIDLNKQQVLDADPKAIQKINFTGNINQGEDVIDNTTIFFFLEGAKETILDFSQGTMKVL